ncbi:MAG: hypothetical protein DMF61_03860 [Blastocatellia bacterium AA13]|nr:MAG: hypothetical protein DMF61_03860 [Blastocatellia bacterium AA13]
MALTYVTAFLTAVVLSFVLTRCVRNIALSRNWFPAHHKHHIHGGHVPRLGGVSIFVTAVLLMAGAGAAAKLFSIDLGFNFAAAAGLLIPGALVFGVGLYDDLRPIKPGTKFIAQGLAALMLLAGGYGAPSFGLFGAKYFPWLSAPATVLWVILISNAFNLIDGLDGLAAGSALFSTVVVLVLALITHSPLVSLMALVMAGAIAGFLRFNFNPATIFLGDCGSLFIGFMLSALALAGCQKTPTLVAVAIPVVSFGLPIAETVLSVLRRSLSGQPLMRPDRNHIHHRLLERGLSQQQAVITLYGVSAICALLALFLLYPGGGSIGIVLVVLGTVVSFGVKGLHYPELRELGRAAQRTVDRKKTIANNVAVRRASERLLNAHNFLEIRTALIDGFSVNDFDGFSLQLDSRAQRFGPDCGVIRWEDTSEWAHASAETPTAEWRLVLDLIGSDGRMLGYLNLYRFYSHSKPALVDVNLITAELRGSLTEAIERLLNQDETADLRVPAKADRIANPLLAS